MIHSASPTGPAGSDCRLIFTDGLTTFVKIVIISGLVKTTLEYGNKILDTQSISQYNYS